VKGSQRQPGKACKILKRPQPKITGKKGEKEQTFLFERAHKDVLTVKKNVHLNLRGVARFNLPR